MSPVELRAPARFLRSELGMVFGRRRNAVLLSVLGLVPVLICVSVRASGRSGRGSTIFGGITENGLFAALAALLVAGPLFLPLVVAVVAGDAVAGEAHSGTLRYLLSVPVGRTRLLAVKFAAAAAWCVACVAVVAVLGVLAGLVLFPSGELTLLSGRAVSYTDGLGRLALVSAYVAASLLMVAALGLFVSTMTEVPIAAIAATLTLTIASQVADAVPQLAVIQGWLPTHRWLRWVDLLRDPVATDGMAAGLLVTLGYVALFVSLAWARFGGKDVTS
ncbi:ABC-2 type transport system permease protein [Jatrophihabitans endophyticus]|uniref:ABC-2 type transport system permease protein n=1 Tax=Jatrophihabitans endophyticus TaxID=1206085 RepID=A0A1M5I7Q0_9ACTN|nr:ABC transporter permease [Jatrophihabitans endophyticus]SHG24282.1 ABC-2 type transport system permease protein [Jatrophihabitans endophyticus]